jgi:hypothetical protein
MKVYYHHSQALIVQDGPLASISGFLISHIQTHGRTPLDERSARRRDLYLHRTTQQTSFPWAGFEPAIPAIKRPQTYALDGAATGIGIYYHLFHIFLATLKRFYTRLGNLFFTHTSWNLTGYKYDKTITYKSITSMESLLQMTPPLKHIH